MELLQLTDFDVLAACHLNPRDKNFSALLHPSLEFPHIQEIFHTVFASLGKEL